MNHRLNKNVEGRLIMSRTDEQGHAVGKILYIIIVFLSITIMFYASNKELKDSVLRRMATQEINVTNLQTKDTILVKSSKPLDRVELKVIATHTYVSTVSTVDKHLIDAKIDKRRISFRQWSYVIVKKYGSDSSKDDFYIYDYNIEKSEWVELLRENNNL